MTWPASSTSNNMGPYSKPAPGKQPPPAENVPQINPIPPMFDSNFGVTATMAFWWLQQGILVPVAPAFSSYNTATFIHNQFNTYIIQASGNPIPTISTSSVLPQGLSLANIGNGQATLSGTPTQTGTFYIVFEAVNSDVYGPNASQIFTLVIQ